MQCALFSRQKLSFKNKKFGCFEFKSKDKYERNFKRKIYIKSFCLMSQVLFFFGASR